VNGPQIGHIWQCSRQLCGSVTCHHWIQNWTGFFLFQARTVFKFFSFIAIFIYATAAYDLNNK
jgi:hypothetical protein